MTAFAYHGAWRGGFLFKMESTVWQSFGFGRVARAVVHVGALALCLGMISSFAASEAQASNGHKRYFVEFRARSAASYGHLYVMYGRVNSRNQIVKSEIAGLFPAGDTPECRNCSVVPWTIGHVLFVPSETGASDGDLEEKYVTSRFRVMVDKAEYEKVRDYIKKFQANPPLWNALWRNCVSFGRDIAGLMGLKMPAFIWLEPKDFVDGLREMNGVDKQLPLRDAANRLKQTMRVPAARMARAQARNQAKNQAEKEPQTETPGLLGLVFGSAR
jgi:hypothetical protein